MKKITLVLVCLLLVATSGVAGTRYIEGSTTGLYYDEDIDTWTTKIIQVYTMHARNLVDDLSYITVGDGSSMVKGFLLERGLPGQPNADTRLERQRFIKKLEEGLNLMEEAKREGKELDKLMARYYSMELKLLSEDKGNNVKIGLLLHDYEKKVDMTVYLNEEEVKGLIGLLEKVPPILKEIVESEPRSPLLP